MSKSFHSAAAGRRAAVISRWVICGGSAAPISESRRDFRKRSEVFGIEQRALRVAGVVHRLRAAWRTEPLERALSFPAANVEIAVHSVKKSIPAGAR